MDIEADIRNALSIERDGLEEVLQKVGEATAHAVTLLRECTGRVIVTGVGKTGLIGRKIAATLSSTGTPAFYIHPAEAIHGDLGAIHSNDIIIAISNSGESSELVELLPHFADLGVKVIALTGVTTSTLGKRSDVVIDVGVSREADPLNLAPTASTTAALAMGDAIAAALMIAKGFTKDAYARNHPGGALGSVLLTRVRDHMVEPERAPIVGADVSLKTAIHEMAAKRLGATFVVDDDGELVGVFTDGDLLRLFEGSPNALDGPIAEVMTRNPKTAQPDEPAIDAMKRMEDHAITLLAVVDASNKPVSAIHLHDLVKSGLALWASERE